MIFIKNTESIIKLKTKMKDMGNTIQRKQATLYVNSKHSDTLPWLKLALMREHKYPHLSKAEFGRLPLAERNIISKRFNQLFDLAKSEWKVNQAFYKKAYGEDIDCELCGKKHLDLLSEITNEANGKKLIVGSTCVTKFGLRGSKEYIENIQKIENRIKNEELIEKRTPGIIQDIDSFHKIKSEKKVILSVNIKKDYDKISQFIKVEYEEILSNKKLRSINFQQIVNLHSEIKNLLDRINKYIEESENIVWGINKKLAYWCYENGNNELIRMLEQSGRVNIYTVDQIKEIGFMKKTILMFEPFIRENNIQIFDKLNISSIFKIVFLKRPNIIIDIPTSSFISKYKKWLFETNDLRIDANDIIQMSSVDNSSLESTLKYICRDGKFYSDYKRLFNNVNTNELVFHNNLNNKIYIINFSNFIQDFKMYILKESLTKGEVEDVKIYIKKNGKEYTKEQYNDYLDISKGKYNKRNN